MADCPMQYTEILKFVKNERLKKKIFFFSFSQSIDFGYKLEPHQQVGSNEYPTLYFFDQN